MFSRALCALVLLSLCPAFAEQSGAAVDVAGAPPPQSESLAPDASPKPAAAAETPPEDSGPRPFDPSANAMQDVDAALLTARTTGKLPLLILGGNWCHDSRGLAAKFEIEPLKTLIETSYQTVWVDVGHRDRNLDVAKRFGVDKILGTPTVIILSADGKVVNADTVHDWRTADSKPFDETVEYFASFAPRE